MSATTGQILTSTDELNALPVGSVVMSLWTPGPLHYVATKFATDSATAAVAAKAGGTWLAPISDGPIYPLGSGNDGQTVLLLWPGLHPLPAQYQPQPARSAKDDMAQVVEAMQRFTQAWGEQITQRFKSFNAAVDRMQRSERDRRAKRGGPNV
jgi:hypothetical protein